MHFFGVFCILNIFEKKNVKKKKIDVNSDVNFRSDVNFFDVTCSKIPKNAIFGKSAEKVLEKWGRGPILTDYSESYAKMKICTKFL